MIVRANADEISMTTGQVFGNPIDAIACPAITAAKEMEAVAARL